MAFASWLFRRILFTDPTPAGNVNVILREDGSVLLREDGSRFVRE